MNIFFDSTHRAYEDSSVVDNYVIRNSLPQKQKQNIEENFAPFLKKGDKVLDLGCGPGHDSLILKNCGFKVIGLDYSKTMIRKAKELYGDAAEFLVGDALNSDKIFSENEFDAVWASASLIHLEAKEMPKVLSAVSKIVKNNGLVFVGLKQGDSKVIYKDNKYGKTIKRKFVLWQKESFLKIATANNLALERFFIHKSSTLFMGKPTTWLRFFLRVRK